MNAKLKAFTLIESVVSLTLISIVVAACLLLINRMGVHDRDVQRAKLMSAEYYSELESGLISSQQTRIAKDGLTLNVEILNYNELDNLYQVKAVVINKDKLLYQTNKLLILNEN